MQEMERENAVRASERQAHIVGAQNEDSLGTAKWRKYLERDKLLDAWKPVEGSPYQQFVKTKTIDAVEKLAPVIKPRYSEGEVTSEIGVQNLIESGNTGRDTAVILDSGGAHSIAMAVKLAEQGYQPVIMFDNTPHPEGMNRSEQELATLLYFAEQIKQLKLQGKIKADAPPVFVLDFHRDDKDIKTTGRKNNTYTYSCGDFPSAEELTWQGITKVVYLNEGDQEGRINNAYQSIERVWRDLKPIVEEWEVKGIKMLYTGIQPWKEKRRISEFSQSSCMRDKGFPSPLFDWRDGLFYTDMPPSVYGNSSGIAMHKERQRYVLTSQGNLMVINEKGRSRDMTPEEREQFIVEIQKQLSVQANNQTLKELYRSFPAASCETVHRPS